MGSCRRRHASGGGSPDGTAQPDGPCSARGAVTLSGVQAPDGASGRRWACGPDPCSGRVGSVGSASDPVPDREADAHLGSVVVGGHQGGPSSAAVSLSRPVLRSGKSQGAHHGQQAERRPPPSPWIRPRWCPSVRNEPQEGAMRGRGAMSGAESIDSTWKPTGNEGGPLAGRWWKWAPSAPDDLSPVRGVDGLIRPHFSGPRWLHVVVAGGSAFRLAAAPASGLAWSQPTMGRRPPSPLVTSQTRSGHD